MTIRAEGFPEGTFKPSEPPARRPVTIADVAPFAQKGHYVCKGRGYVRKAGKVTTPCKCAQKRFMKAKAPEIVVDKDETVWWKG